IWQDKLRALAVKIGYSRPVRLAESALVQTPLALGFLKPLILLPLGMINRISPAEVEAVLAHELAHIARRDWLFNLIQALVEALFYFHPAVWWISATIRAERENCCDDTAIALTGNRLLYAKTLVRLQDMAKSAKTPTLALAMEGSPGLLRRRPLLLERIKRILHQPQQSASFMEKMIATAILLALITLWTVQANTPPAITAAIRAIAEKPVAWLTGAPEPEAAFQAPADTVKPQRRKIIQEDDDRRVEMEMLDDKITRLNVDGKEIPESEFPQYQSLTDELRRDVAPAPPAPPFPPGVWVLPPVAPRAPMPPIPGNPSRISTDKDEAGNTIIRLERDGKPTEIKVRDGEVWIDGKKMESGESLDIPGDQHPFLFWQGNEGYGFRLDDHKFYFPGTDSAWLALPDAPDAPALYHFDGDQFIFETPEGKIWEVPMPDISEEELKRIQEEALRGIELHQKEIQKQLKESEKEWKKSRKEWEKAKGEQRRAMEEARRELEKARIAQREALTRARADQARAREEARTAQRAQLRAYRERSSAEATGKILKEALIADKLIGDPNNFSFELSGKELRVDGKKLSDEQHKKYLELYQKRSGKALGKNDSIRIEEEN
ncbi:MAG: M48 family metalloprotease, partial [Thermoanaerobaculia bacterium]|nr:M48 family metalloprotease [Thermoanaerobaculia bacterium]